MSGIAQVTRRQDAHKVCAATAWQCGAAQRLAYGPQRRGSKPWSSKRMVQVSVLTDTDAVIAAQGRLQQLMAQGQPGTTVVAGAAATAALRQQHAGVPTLLAGTPQSRTELLLADMMQQSRQLGPAHLAAGAGRELLSGTEGRLALAGVLVNAIGLMRASAAESAAADKLVTTTDAEAREKLEQQIQDARLGWYDSLGGLTGASLDSVRVGVQFMQLRTLGSAATVSVTALQFGAALAGTFGGFLNAYVSGKKAIDSYQKRLMPIAALHATAALASFGLGMIGTVQGVAYGATALAMRGIGGQVVASTAKTLAEAKVEQLIGRRVAALVGQRLAQTALLSALPVAGWALLAIGVGATLGAMVLEPSELEAWARQTPFGAGPDKDKFKDLDALFGALQQALGQAQEANTPAASEVPA